MCVQEMNGMISEEMQDMKMSKTDHSVNQHMIIVETKQVAMTHTIVVSLKDV